jgi:type I restriction enzyme, S subunit
MIDSAPQASDLPAGWDVASFGELNSFSGGTVNPATRPDEVFELYSVPSFPTGRPEQLPGHAIGSTKQTVSPGDVLVCKINPRINRVWSVGARGDHEQIASSEWIGFRSDALVPRFAKHYFSEPSFRALLCSEVSGVGGSLTRAQPSRVATYPVPVAPLAEQTRIADQLDTLLTRIRACQDRLETIPALLKRFRQAVVSAGISGGLTADFRDPSAETEYTESELQALCEADRVITYGVVKLGDEVPYGTPCLRTSNVRWLRFENDGMKCIAPSLSAQYSRTVLSGGEVLVNVRGTLGGVAVSTQEMKGWNVSREIAVVAIGKSRASAEYVALWIASDASQRWLSGMKKGVAYVGINIEDLRRLPVRLPARDEQDEIVRRVHSYLKLADQIEARCATATEQARKLAPLTLDKAFRGELVPQDPTDEPASILLERMRTARASPAPAAKAKARTRRSDLKAAADQTLVNIIDQMGKAEFTFDELRQHSSRDYESLKADLFALLADKKSGIDQYFDESEGSMKLRRISK